MRRTSLALLVGLLLLLTGVGRAADTTTPAGNWKMSIFQKGSMNLIGLIQLESADKKWTIKSLMETRGPKVSDAEVADGMLRFKLTIPDGPAFLFEGQLPKGEIKTITGNFSKGDDVIPAELERTTLTKIDRFSVQKEAFAKATGYEITDAGLSLLSMAEMQKVKPDEVRTWAEKVYKAAVPYGSRVETDTALKIARTLTEQDGYADVALIYAQKAEKALTPKSKISRVKEALELLESALKMAGKTDEAKAVGARIDKLNPEITPKPFAGRTGKSDRVVLVELFTGSQCPPCVAADMAFDALAKTYKPSEAVLLEYHVHVPGPDPLTNAASEARFEFYGKRFQNVEGTPALILDGKPGVLSGGGRFDAIDNYEEYLDKIKPLLEAPAKASLTLSAVRKGNKIDIAWEASEVRNPSETVHLRLALVEDTIEYKGGNGVPSFHHVVRAMPDGAEGVVVKDRREKKSVSVDLDELKKELKKSVEDLQKKAEKIPGGKVPEPELKKLRVVAFLQNDKTAEILQTSQVEVKSEK